MDGGPETPSYFDRFADLVIEAEGPDTNDSLDAGGYTRFGISQRWHKDIDVRSLTLEQAKTIYKRDCWVPIHGDDLPPPLALVVFDGAVIPGLGWAMKALQTVLRVEGDGVIGPDTLAAARHASWRTVLAFTAARAAEFERQVRIYPYKTKYSSGWRNRTLAMFREAVLLEPRA